MLHSATHYGAIAFSSGESPETKNLMAGAAIRVEEKANKACNMPSAYLFEDISLNITRFSGY
jgi:hypothetical protein